MPNPVKILAIENDEFMRIFLKDVFWLHGISGGYEFYMCDNLKKAEELVANPKTEPNLIFLDLTMPEYEGGNAVRGTGFHFLERLKSDPKTKNIKVVIFSAYGDKEIQDKAMKLGAEKFLLKGEHLPQELIQTTQEVLSKSSNK